MPTKKRTLKAPAPRKKKNPAYRSFRLSNKIESGVLKNFPSTKTLWSETLRFMWKHRVKMLVFALIYAGTYLVLVKGISGFDTDMDIVKEELQTAMTGNIGAILTFLSLYATLLSSVTATTGDVANFYQSSVIIIFSLAFIWLVRKLHARDSSATVRDTFYRGMGPLIPFLGVLFILALELVPAGLGSLLLTTASSTEAIRSNSDIIAISIVMLLTVVLSIYLLAGSIFSLYIVTLPGTRPFVAVRSSLRLLSVHRWRVLLKVITFFITLIIVGFFLVLPFIIWLPRWADVAFFFMSALSFGFMHTYMYKLYRSLL